MPMLNTNRYTLVDITPRFLTQEFVGCEGAAQICHAEMRTRKTHEHGHDTLTLVTAPRTSLVERLHSSTYGDRWLDNTM